MSLIYRRVRERGLKRLVATAKRAFVFAISGVMLAMSLAIPLPFAPFVEAAKRLLRRNQPVLIVREEQTSGDDPPDAP